MTPYQELLTIEDFNKALQLSETTPVLIFKHSITCGVSERAFKQFQQYLETPESRNIHNCVIIIQNSRNLSDEVARVTNIIHESPQAILIKNKQTVWNDSHLALKLATFLGAVQD